MNSILIHYSEIGLKGGNRFRFEEQLCDNVARQLIGCGVSAVRRIEGRIVCRFDHEFREGEWLLLAAKLRLVFGIASFSPALETRVSMERVTEGARVLMGEPAGKTFAVRTHRAYKKFPKTSEEVNRELGEQLQHKTQRAVNLTKPDVTLDVEITSRAVFLRCEKILGPGGLPVGTAGKVIALLSGGIDSPVAAWKVMKRGCETIFAHFHSYPHTSRASISKVGKLAEIIGAYQPETKLYFIPFADAQREIVMRCTPKFRVLLYRRLMVRIASELAKREGALGIVTGESIGQVASQTLPNLRAVEAASLFPVFRPLIGDDKLEIIAKAKSIGTLLTSIEPHDDCCSLFVPAHPATAASIQELEMEEAKLEVDRMVHEALNSMDSRLRGNDKN